jgi:hypothetical protein
VTNDGGENVSEMAAAVGGGRWAGWDRPTRPTSAKRETRRDGKRWDEMGGLTNEGTSRKGEREDV